MQEFKKRVKCSLVEHGETAWSALTANLVYMLDNRGLRVVCLDDDGCWCGISLNEVCCESSTRGCRAISKGGLRSD